MDVTLKPLLNSIGTNSQKKNFRIFTIVTTSGIIAFLLIYLVFNENYSSEFGTSFEWKSALLSSNKCNYGPNGPRIYCAVLTHFGNLQTKAQSVRKTWGRRCDKIIFGTGRKPNGTNKTIHEILPEAVELDTSDAYGNLTAKSISMLKYVYETTKPGDFDWLLKADDDTYVIMDNLKWFLNDHCPNETHTYGLNFNIGGNKYHSGGGGYTISSSIVHKLGLSLRNNNSFCSMKSGYEDIEVAECLKKLNVTLGESRDSKGRERFHGASFSDHFDGIAKWMESYAMYWPKYGPDCCSPTSITFHYVDVREMFRFDHIFHKIRRVKLNFNPNISDYD